MRESLKATLTWPGMTEAIRQWVRNCKTCARSKDRGPKYGKIPVKNMGVRPWSDIGVDSLGPLESENRWRALTIIDTSTRLVEIINMDHGTSAEAARIVDQQWFNRYPHPERCIYAQGPEFRAEVQELLQSYGVEYAGNTAKKPQANGVIERVHRTINNKLRTTVIWNRGDDVRATSAIPHNEKMSPSQAVFGREMLFDRQQKHKELQVKRANAKENTGRKEHEYKPEDLVMVTRSNQRAPKLQPLFDGPFRVFSVRSDGILVIDKRKYQASIHMRRVKPFQSSSMGEDVVTS
ncbi:Pol Polyprotein [Phytophthora megakarya]|uniref:Pol Polyprotein n=1 Tax=Phytophthora megakarya TaxID=4795 RepID=A0A225WBL1_9STRA|nr:Pol Polyprotein [Phytophthora megakarya]